MDALGCSCLLSVAMLRKCRGQLLEGRSNQTNTKRVGYQMRMVAFDLSVVTCHSPLHHCTWDVAPGRACLCCPRRRQEAHACRLAACQHKASDQVGSFVTAPTQSRDNGRRSYAAPAGFQPLLVSCHSLHPEPNIEMQLKVARPKPCPCTSGLAAWAHAGSAVRGFRFDMDKLLKGPGTIKYIHWPQIDIASP